MLLATFNCFPTKTLRRRPLRGTSADPQNSQCSIWGTLKAAIYVSEKHCVIGKDTDSLRSREEAVFLSAFNISVDFYLQIAPVAFPLSFAPGVPQTHQPHPVPLAQQLRAGNHSYQELRMLYLLMKAQRLCFDYVFKSQQVKACCCNAS